LFARDVLSHSLVNGQRVYPVSVPYLQYPFEYPFFSGLLQLLVNLFAESSPQPLLAATLFSSVMMGGFAAGIVLLYYFLGVGWRRVGLYFASLPLVLMQFDVSYDLAQAFLFLLAYYFLVKRRREGVSAVLLALSAGTKLLPLLFFPAYLKEVKGKGRYAALFFSVFLGGLAAQLLLNVNNTLRTLSFESHYGVEGSWLGFLFPGSVIQYRVATWIIGDATTLTVKPVYFVSAALLLPSTILVYVSRLTLEHKMFLILSLEVAFLWLSPPQFMLNLAALAPLVFEVDWKKVASWWAVTIFATPLLLSDILYLLGLSHQGPGGLIVYPAAWWLTVGAATQLGVLSFATVFCPPRKR